MSITLVLGKLIKLEAFCCIIITDQRARCRWLLRAKVHHFCWSSFCFVQANATTASSSEMLFCALQTCAICFLYSEQNCRSDMRIDGSDFAHYTENRLHMFAAHRTTSHCCLQLSLVSVRSFRQAMYILSSTDINEEKD